MAEAKQGSAAVPVQFGKYLLDGEIARGGMSRVYRARLRGPGGFEKKLVVKQILPHLAQDPSFVELFVREANTLVQMSHGNIVPVYELGVVDGVYFLAMELVPGATVAELLKDGPLPQELVAEIGIHVCEALRYAHERFELVHRDVTPRNVIVDADGHVRLLDFGIAAPLAKTGQGERFGSPGYMSPEQAGGRTLAAQSDLFSLGTVLFEALTGRRAIARVPEGEVQPLPERLGPDDAHDGVLCAVIDDLLEVDVDARPAAAADVAGRLRRWMAEHHPGGVARALGERAEAARARASEPGAAALSDGGTGSSSNTPQITRSIATSRALDAIISQATEPLAGRGADASTEATQPLSKATQPLAAGRDEARGRGRAVLWPLSALVIAGALLLFGEAEEAPPAGDAGTAAARGTAPPPASQAEPAAEPAAEPVPGPAAEPAPAPATEPAPAPATEPDPDATPAPDPATTRARARLTINAMPWAAVSLDGKPLGNTPRRAVSIPSGKHTLTLDCPPLGKKARVPIDVPPGEHTRIVVDLQQDPPKVTRR